MSSKFTCMLVGFALAGFGVTSVGAVELPSTPPAALVETRRGGTVSLANWTSSLLRWELRAGAESWGDATDLLAPLPHRAYHGTLQ